MRIKPTSAYRIYEFVASRFVLWNPEDGVGPQVLGYGKYTSQTQLNFINIKSHINDYMFRPLLFN